MTEKFVNNVAFYIVNLSDNESNHELVQIIFVIEITPLFTISLFLFKEIL